MEANANASLQRALGVTTVPYGHVLEQQGPL
jgi:hypothetical protein